MTRRVSCGFFLVDRNSLTGTTWNPSGGELQMPFPHIKDGPKKDIRMSPNVTTPVMYIASRLEAIASRLEGIAIRLEAIDIVGWRASLLGWRPSI